MLMTDKKVVIKKEAFRNMISHVLRFGSIALENSVEVMGVCLGKSDSTNDQVTINNAIPVMHGLPVSVGFSKQEIELFHQIENQYKEEIVGWYISRPSWGLDFTEVTISNHQFFQNEKTPQGFCIVFDHTLMNKIGNLGFQIYRLDDYSKTDKFSNVSYEIEIPSTLEYFKWIQKFMEDFQKKDPILIKEINEIIEQVPGDLQEIPTSVATEQIEEQLVEYPEISSIVSRFKQGSEKLSEAFMNTIQTQIGSWINDVEQGNLRGSGYISNTVNKMKEAVVSGLLNVSNWFKKELNEALYDFKNEASNYVDTRIDDHRKVTEEISEVKQNLVNNLNNLIEEKLGNINSEIENLITSTTQKLGETTRINVKIEEMVNKLDNNINTINNQMKLFTQGIDKNVRISSNPLQANITEKIEKLSTELEPFKNNYSEIRTLLDKLQKTITDFRNIP